MKIEIESLDDLRDLIGVMDPEFLRAWQPALGRSFRAADIARDVRTGTCGLQVESEASAVEPDGLPTDIAQPERVEYADVAPPTRDKPENDDLPAVDADGAPYSADWHSDPAKLTGKGYWRARRGRDEAAYKAWLLSLAVEVAEAAIAADAEPVATETHALPQDDAETAGDAPEVQAEPETAGDAAPTVDLAALVEANQEAALDASDSHMDLIKACQVFISDHGHPAYNALKAAVAPLEGAENGKAVPQFTPAERRLMRACIDNYPSN